MKKRKKLFKKSENKAHGTYLIFFSPLVLTVGTGSFPGVKSGRGVSLTPNPFLVPSSRKGRAIPLLFL